MKKQKCGGAFFIFFSSINVETKNVCPIAYNFEIAEAMNKAQQEVIEALHIMESTVENFDDPECLQLNKERMIKYLNRFSDEVLSER